MYITLSIMFLCGGDACRYEFFRNGSKKLYLKEVIKSVTILDELKTG